MKKRLFLLFGFCLIFLCFSVIAYTPSSVTNNGNARDILNSSNTRLVEIIMLGDSNQLKDAGGWDHAWQQSMLNRNYTMYASGNIPYYDNGGSGSGVGYGVTENRTRFRSGNALGTVPASQYPGLCNYWCAELSTENFVRGQFVDSANSSANATNAGIALDFGTALGYGLTGDDLLQYRNSFAYFNSVANATPSSHFQFSIINVSITLLSAPQQFTNSTFTGFNYSYYKFLKPSGVAAGNSATIDFRKQNPSTSGTTAYPYYITFQNIVRVNKTAGFQGSTLYGQGSANSGNLSNYMVTMNATRIGNYIRFLTDYQIEKNQTPVAIIVIDFGVNDAGASLSGFTYENNTNNTINVIRHAWSDLGYNLSNLQFIIMPTFPTQNDDANLIPYRQGARNLAQNYSYVTFVNMSAFTNNSELNQTATTPRYYAITDHNHLNQTDNNANNSYVVLVNRAINEILDTPTQVSIIINSPQHLTYAFSEIPFNITTSNPSVSVNYTLNNGATNFTMTSLDNLTWYATQSLANADYVVRFFVTDNVGNMNNTENVSFTVSPPNPGGGGGSSAGDPPVRSILVKKSDFTGGKNATINVTTYSENSVLVHVDSITANISDLGIYTFTQSTTTTGNYYVIIPIPDINQTRTARLTITVKQGPITLTDNSTIVLANSGVEQVNIRLGIRDFFRSLYQKADADPMTFILLIGASIFVLVVIYMLTSA